MTPFVSDPDFTLHIGDALDVLRELPDESVHCCVTSPPYWGLRDYGTDGQLGLEATPEEYVAAMVEVFREVRRVLRAGGTCWLNIGDSYAGSWGAQGRESPPQVVHAPDCDMDEDCRCDIFQGEAVGYGISAGQIAAHPRKQSRTGSIPKGATYKPKDLVGIPWRLAFALQADGWFLRSDIIWSKPNPMPESVTDRPTKAHEYLFLLTRSARYFYDANAIREPAEWARWGDQTNGKHEGAGGSAGWIGSRSKADLQRGRTWDERKADGAPIRHGLDGAAAHGEGGFVTPAMGRNRRSVWEIATEPYPDAHFATFPQALVEPCIKAGCPEGGTVIDCFMGSGTTALVARRLGRKSIGIELNEEYARLAAKRLGQQSLLAEPAA